MAHLHKQQNFCFVLLFVALTIAYARKAIEVSFQQNYKVVWGKHHVFFVQHGREVQLSIDKTSGAGFRSKLEYASGFFQMRIKIPNKDTHTHTFYVDEIPIGVFKNYSNVEVSFPSKQMHVTASIWNGEPWASNGKRIDWKQAPFTAQFQGFNIHGCRTQNRKKHACYSPYLWWNDKRHWELNPQQQRAYEDVGKKHLLYDYCSDRAIEENCTKNVKLIRSLIN